MKKRKSERWVKCVVPVTQDEFLSNKAFTSILDVFSPKRTQIDADVWDSGKDLTFMYLDAEGDIKSHPARKMTVCSDVLNDMFNGGTLLAVKLIYSDGSWEYGFKYWTDHARPTGRRVLRPLFTRIGYLDEAKVGLNAMPGPDDRVPPAWIANLVPMYNERIEDAVQREDKSIETGEWSIDDWGHLCKFMSTNYVTDNAKYMELPFPIKGIGSKCPMSISFRGTAHMQRKLIDDELGKWKQDLVKALYGPASGYIACNHAEVLLYSYLKSVYEEQTTHRRAYSVFPLSNLMFISSSRWAGDKYEYIHLWDNMDQTIHGNV